MYVKDHWKAHELIGQLEGIKQTWHDLNLAKPPIHIGHLLILDEEQFEAAKDGIKAHLKIQFERITSQLRITYQIYLGIEDQLGYEPPPVVINELSTEPPINITADSFVIVEPEDEPPIAGFVVEPAPLMHPDIDIPPLTTKPLLGTKGDIDDEDLMMF